MKTVGILGGGQLGAMLIESLASLGVSTHVFDPSPDAPAFRLSTHKTVASFSDANALETFFKRCDIVTFEFENIETLLFHKLEKLSQVPLCPPLHVLEITQNRLHEKTFCRDKDLPVVPFCYVKNHSEIYAVEAAVGFPAILKTVKGGYDGKGQMALYSRADFANIPVNYFPAIAESKIELAFEASCIVATPRKGESVVFPIFENIHKNHILDTTVFPARLPKELCHPISETASEACDKMQSKGILAVEFFVTKRAFAPGARTVGDWSFYINEFAPRPHNSGHLTRQACLMSQFDAHARILLDLPLTQPCVPASGCFVMGNLLGDVFTPEGEVDLSAWQNFSDVVDVTLYGKREGRASRKMGHFVVYHEDAVQAVQVAHEFRIALGHDVPRR